MAYTNKGNIQKYLNVDIASSFDTQIAAWITAVEAWINRYTGKQFEVGADETRYFDTCGGRSVFVDSFTGTPTTVAILNSDGSVSDTLTEGQSNDYLAYPLNTTEKNEIRLTPNGSRAAFPHGSSRLKIVGKFGYQTLPVDIELCATRLVSKIVEKGLKGGELTQVQLGDFTSNFKVIDEEADALGIYQILDSYRELEI